MVLQNDHIRKLVTVWIPFPIILALIFYIIGIAGLKDSIQAAGGVILGATISTILLIIYDKRTTQDEQKTR